MRARMASSTGSGSVAGCFDGVELPSPPMLPGGVVCMWADSATASSDGGSCAGSCSSCTASRSACQATGAPDTSTCGRESTALQQLENAVLQKNLAWEQRVENTERRLQAELQF